MEGHEKTVTDTEFKGERDKETIVETEIVNENERERDRQGRRGQREIFIKRGCRKSEGNGKSEGKSVKMRRNRRGILKDGEKKGGRERERGKSEEKVTC